LCEYEVLNILNIVISPAYPKKLPFSEVTLPLGQSEHWQEITEIAWYQIMKSVSGCVPSVFFFFLNTPKSKSMTKKEER